MLIFRQFVVQETNEFITIIISVLQSLFSFKKALQ